jgi:hypothetical protein
MEMILAFLAGWLLSWPALGVLFVLGVLLEYASWRGTAVFVGIVAAVSAYFFFQISLQTLAIAAAIYFVVGVLWSFWRYRVYVREAVATATTKMEKERLYRYEPGNNLGKITAWIIVWPFSMVENVIQDVIRFAEMLVKEVFHKVYERIFQSAIKGVVKGDKDV